MEAGTMIALYNFGMALLLIAISVPLAMRKVGRNGFYGVRTPKAMESDANWYNINALVGRQMLIWSIPSLLIGVICFFFPIIHGPEDSWLAFALTGGPTCLNSGVPLLYLWRYEKKL